MLKPRISSSLFPFSYNFTSVYFILQFFPQQYTPPPHTHFGSRLCLAQNLIRMSLAVAGEPIKMYIPASNRLLLIMSSTLTALSALSLFVNVDSSSWKPLCAIRFSAKYWRCRSMFMTLSIFLVSTWLPRALTVTPSSPVVLLTSCSHTKSAI